jgi:hypothetical protein
MAAGPRGSTIPAEEMTRAQVLSSQSGLPWDWEAGELRLASTKLLEITTETALVHPSALVWALDFP